MANKVSLYKYIQLKYLESALENGIYASQLKMSNDPFEAKNIIDMDINNYRIVCMSTSYNQKLMWSHYADGHRGCLLKVTAPDNFDSEKALLRKVTYSSSIKNKLCRTAKEVLGELYIKDKKWKSEKEVRAALNTAEVDNDLWKCVGKNYYLRVDISQVDLGCASHNDPDYSKALFILKEYNKTHEKKITVRKYKMSDKKYMITIDKDFKFDE